MARVTLVPQRKEFFQLYNRAAANAVAISRLLVDLLGRKPDGETADLIREIKELEHEGDRLTHEVVDLLNRTFVTPFDRDDMYRLAGALDGFCDSKRQLIELRELEDEGDRLNTEAISELFRSADDALFVIRWKDIHE